MPQTPLLKSKLFWVGILYFAQGFPFGVFYDVLPVHFRQQGVDLREIGLLSLLGLAWTVKFLWAPAVDYYPHHPPSILAGSTAWRTRCPGRDAPAGRITALPSTHAGARTLRRTGKQGDTWRC